MEKMSTPERLERMQAKMAERNAQMQKRMEGTKIFYASLTAEQKQVFDKESAHAMGRMVGGMHRMKHADGHTSKR
jgi:Spy/CpxP family protein refolding chaperone